MSVYGQGYLFDRDYFENGVSLKISGYESYRWLAELTIPMASEMARVLGIKRSETIIDFGCAHGFLVKALHLLHYKAWGVDISEYAISQAPEDMREHVACMTDVEAYAKIRKHAPFNWLISKDVLEHVPYEQLIGTLVALTELARRAFVIVPLGDGKKYNAPEYEKDVTHKIRQPVEWWDKRFTEAGFVVETISTEMPFIKRSRCKNSDGFFRLRSRR